MKPRKKNPQHPQRIRDSLSAGFTLMELLIVIVLIAALAALMFPLVGHMKGKAQAAESVSRIRQCGLIVQEKAAGNNNLLMIHVNGTSSGIQDFRLHGMVQDAVGKERVSELVYTPAYEKKASGTWPVWATNVDDNPEIGVVWENVKLKRGNTEHTLNTLRLAKADNMARYPLLAESSNSVGIPRARFGNDNNHKFAMRYRGKGAIYFLDGATRLVGQGDMAKYGITHAYLFDNDPTANPTLVTASIDSY